MFQLLAEATMHLFINCYSGYVLTHYFFQSCNIILYGMHQVAIELMIELYFSHTDGLWR